MQTNVHAIQVANFLRREEFLSIFLFYVNFMYLKGRAKILCCVDEFFLSDVWAAFCVAG